MATDTTINKVEYPSYITDRQQQLLNQLFGTSGSPGGLIDQDLDVPGKKVAGLQQPTLDAIQMARQGIGAYEPYLQGAGASQQSALATTKAGQEAVQQGAGRAAKVVKEMDCEGAELLEGRLVAGAVAQFQQHQ